MERPAKLEPPATSPLCANPTVGGRGILSLVVASLGGVPLFHRASLVP